MKSRNDGKKSSMARCFAAFGCGSSSAKGMTDEEIKNKIGQAISEPLGKVLEELEKLKNDHLILIEENKNLREKIKQLENHDENKESSKLTADSDAEATEILFQHRF